MRRDMAITLVVASAIIIFGLILIITQTQNVDTLESNIADARATVTAQAEQGLAQSTEMADVMTASAGEAATAQADVQATAAAEGTAAFAAGFAQSATEQAAALGTALAEQAEAAATAQAETLSGAAAAAESTQAGQAVIAATEQAAALGTALAEQAEAVAATQAVADATATFAEIRIGTLEPVFPTMQARAQATESALTDALAAAEATQAALASALATSESRPTSAPLEMTPTFTPAAEADAAGVPTDTPAPDSAADMNAMPLADVAVSNLRFAYNFDAAGDWFTGETEQGTVELRDGEYVFTIFEPPSNLRAFNLPFVTNSYMEATFYVDECGDTAYTGLLFRTSDATDGYVFLVACTLDLWAIIELSNDTSNVLVVDEFTLDGVDRQAGQTLGVYGLADTLQLYLNGTLLGEATSATYDRGIIGFYVEANETPASVRWDNLRIWNLP